MLFLYSLYLTTKSLPVYTFVTVHITDMLFQVRSPLSANVEYTPMTMRVFDVLHFVFTLGQSWEIALER